MKRLRYPVSFYHGKKGSFVLEAALIMSALLIAAAFMLSAILVEKAECSVSTALDSTAAELSLILALVETAAEDLEALSELSQMIKDISADDPAALIDQAMLDLSSSILLGAFIEARSRHWLIRQSRHNKLPLHLIDSGKFRLEWKPAEHALLLHQVIYFKTPLGRMKRTVTACSALWTGTTRASADLESSAKKDSIWMIDNFSRGKKLREMYGGNLPANYPVIAAYFGQQATSIKSIDLTAPSYESEENITRVISRAIDDLAEFKGYQSGSGNYPLISESEIDSRRLLLIIPDNSPDSFDLQILPGLNSYAGSQNVMIEVIRHGNSFRYSDN